MKKIISVVLVFLMVCAMVIPATAKENLAQPRWSYLDNISAGLEINWLGVASCSGHAVARYAVDIKVVVTLQQQESIGWTTIRSWSSTGSGTASASGQYAVYRGYTYRVTVVAYVYNDNGTIVEVGNVSETFIF